MKKRQYNPKTKRARRKGKMPPALAAYWAKHRRGKKKAARRVRRSNPRQVKLYALYARRPGGRALKYLGGMKFAERGTPVYFRSARVAIALGNHLRKTYPVLRAYKIFTS